MYILFFNIPFPFRRNINAYLWACRTEYGQCSWDKVSDPIMYLACSHAIVEVPPFPGNAKKLPVTFLQVGIYQPVGWNGD